MKVVQRIKEAFYRIFPQPFRFSFGLIVVGKLENLQCDASLSQEIVLVFFLKLIKHKNKVEFSLLAKFK